MSFRTLIVIALVVVFAASPSHAQGRSDLWRDYAHRLPANAFVSVELGNGKSIQGHIVRVTEDTLVVLPKTRIAVPARTIAFDDVQSIESRAESMSPGAKVLIGVGSVGGALAAIVVIALAGMR
jgi:hypothetical protein